MTKKPVTQKLNRAGFLFSLVAMCAVSHGLQGCSPLLKSGSPAKSQKGPGNSSCPMEFKKLDFCAQFVPLEEPVQAYQATSFKLKFWRKAGAPDTQIYEDPSLTPFTWLWMKMKSGSHGSLPITTTQSEDDAGESLPGIFDVKGAFFNMPGLWEMHLELRKEDGSKVDEAVYSIQI